MHKKRLLNGTVKRHPDGFGFFIPDDLEHPDVYIPRTSMDGIMTNDKVTIEVFPERGTDRFRGEVVKILERGTRKIVGRFYRMNDRIGMVRDEGKGWGQDLKIKMEDSLNAQNKELVAAEILSYPDESKGFIGKVTEVIGDALDPLTDIKRVIHSLNIPQEFSAATLKEAATFGEVPEEKDYKGRKDLRNKNLITIDGATAKDFDDAVLVETTDRGFKLFVAIADVSHYVKLNSAIDKDAYDRGTSVYFPNFVVPMLPEVLSNGLCSLNPHVPRLCLVAEMLFDFTGEMVESNFYEAVMESKARVTYGEAQDIIDGQNIEKFAHVKEGILRLADLAKILMAKRFKEGSLDLEIPETELVIDGGGVPVDIQRSERLFSHRLIEEMMLAANVAVAKFFNAKQIPALYRIHEPPNEMAIRTLEKYLANFGGTTKLDSGKLQKRLTKALEEFKGKPEAQVLHILTLRSMSQAKYNHNNLGHFGLGFEFYTHFTSPIRRYPDLIVHRLLKNQIMPNSQYRLMAEDDLASAGTVLSASEQRSTKAERQVQSIKKARFMEKFVGQEFDGMISSVAKFGVFVLLREFDVDGLVRTEDLDGDRYEYDEENIRLVGKRSGFSYSIGDMVRIQVVSADPEMGQINFALAESLELENRTPAQLSAEKLLKTLHKQPSKGSKQRSTQERSEKRGSRKEAGSGAKHESRHENKKTKRGHSDKKKHRDSHRDLSDKPDQTQAARPSKSSSRFFEDKRRDSEGQKQKIQKIQKTYNRPIVDDSKSGPDEKLMNMILGPAKYRDQKAEQDKPKLSKKLMFAEQTKLRDNDSYSEKNGDTSQNRSTNRKNSKKRRKT